MLVDARGKAVFVFRYSSIICVWPAVRFFNSCRLPEGQIISRLSATVAVPKPKVVIEEF